MGSDLQEVILLQEVYPEYPAKQINKIKLLTNYAVNFE